MGCTPMGYITRLWIHAREMHTREMHTREMHARMVYANGVDGRKVYAMRWTPVRYC
jgi:hypothetical protein